MKFRDDFKRLLEKLNPRFRSNGVFNTEYTLSELEAELERRERVIRKIEKKAEKNHKRKKRYLEKAAETMWGNTDRDDVEKPRNEEGGAD